MSMYTNEGDAESELKEPEKLWPNATRVQGTDETMKSSHLIPIDVELAQLSIRSRASVLMEFTLNDAGRVKARIDRELALLEERKRLLIGIKDSIREVMQ